VYSPTMIIALDHMNELQAEAAANRLAQQAKRPESRSASRIAVALTSVRSLLANSAEGPTVLPKLTDYPYRS
jgi:hypothetical protein